MKRLGVTMLFGGAALALFLYVQPRLTIHVLANALKDSDTEAIRERMDAERVRQSLWEAYVAGLGHPPDDGDRNAASVASLVLFGRGIELIMATSDDAAQSPAKVAESTFESASRFHATIEQDDNPPITLILERDGARWQVVAMIPSSEAWQQLGDTQPHQ